MQGKTNPLIIRYQRAEESLPTDKYKFRDIGTKSSERKVKNKILTGLILHKAHTVPKT